MVISYQDALAILESNAKDVVSGSQDRTEILPTKDVLHRVASQDVFTTVHTPAADTSAMDGYAVSSASTIEACPDKPVTLRVRGIVAAGDSTIRAQTYGLLAGERLECFDSPPCVEIMTGARFPHPFIENDVKWTFDSCIRLEDVKVLESKCCGRCQLIQIFKPVKFNANRRFAGEDFAKSDIVIEKGQTLRSQHIMALASLGIAEVNVFRRTRIAILSTGTEVVPYDSPATDFQVRDANGPFLETALQSLQAEVYNLGQIPDDAQRFVSSIGTEVYRDDLDVVITTGGVSCGRYDFVEEALSRLKGSSKFHHVAVRPGHPVLFGTIPSLNGRSCAFFGLPGNPLASVVCFRFFVVPYLRFLHNLPNETRILHRVYTAEPSEHPKDQACFSRTLVPPSHLQIFRLGKWAYDSEGRCVRLVANQGSHKIKPLLEADCWVLIPPHDSEHKAGSVLYTMPFHTSSIGR